MIASIKSATYLLSFLLLFTLSCKEKNPDTDCGCDGPAVTVIENAQASVVRDKGLILRLKNADDTIYEEWVTTCNMSDTLTLTPDVKYPDYIVSGNTKRRCFYGPSSMMLPTLFEITKISKSL